MLNSKPVQELIFIDLETTSQYPTFKDMPDKLQSIFKRRYKKQFGEMEDKFNSKTINEEEYNALVEYFYDITAPLQPEWGRILCISMGTLIPTKNEKGEIVSTGDYTMKITSFADENENKLLTKFIAATEGISKGPNWKYHFVAHHGIAFDFPFLAKRIIMNELPLPNIWDFGHKKPWELDFLIDTKIVWRYGVYDNAVSLDHLAYIFGLPSSKDTMDGSQVKDEFWISKNLRGITSYCELDILVLAQIYLKMKGMKNKITRS